VKSGRSASPLSLYAAIGANDEPFEQSVELDYGLAFTRELANATPLGSKIVVRTVIGAFVGVFSGVRIRTTRPFGIWIEEIFVDFDTQVSFQTAPTVTANLANVPAPPFSFEADSFPVAMPASITIEQGTSAAPLANLAFVLANAGLSSRVGGRFWLPPNVYLEATRIAVNLSWSGTVALSYQAT